MNPELIVKLSLDIGAAMLSSGAETIRVEDTVSRICRTYYQGNLDVTSYLSALFVSMEVTDWDESSTCPRIVTQHRRVTRISHSLDRLEDLNTLSRYICANKPDPQDIEERLQSILHSGMSVKRGVTGYILGASGFAIFFGGNIVDAFFCGLISLLLYYVDNCIHIHFNNELIRTFILSFITGLPACLLELSPIMVHMDKIMIGTVMLLIPGVALTNSLRDLFTGDTVSGALKLLNSILLAVAIALGFALAMILTGV